MIKIMSPTFPDLLAGLPSTENPVAPDTLVFQRDDPVTRVFMVVDGQIRLIRRQVDGSAAILQRARHGDLLAEASILSEHYHCAAETVDWTTLRAWRKADVTRLLEQDAAASLAFQKYLAREVRAARLRAEIIALRRLGDRLDAWLTWHEGMLPERGNWRQLTEDINVSPEALYRELSRRRRLA